MTEYKNTKEKILVQSLKLFSINGFEAVSIRTIADAVGIGNSALYKHYKSKREIFDSIVQMEKERYLQACSSAMEKMKDLENVKKITLEMFKFQTTDESIVAFRRLLLIEKFRDPEIAEIYKNFFIDIPIQYQIKIFKKLQKNGLMIQGNAQVFAMELYSPFYLYHFVEFEPEKLFPLLRKHVEYFLEGHMIHK